MNDQKTILIIDDEEANVNMLIELLVDKYEILPCLNGKDGLEIVKEEKIDLILLDIMMPEIDGYEVCRILKSNDTTKEIPVIFITAKTDEEAIEKAYDVGGVDYITKPFKAREVFSRINNHLSLAQQKTILEKNLKTNINLLNQYKDVVDKSTIVSKTDLNGKITYVNDEFCNISGFSRDELLGKNHNIVRDPHTSKSIYKDMWNSIQHKQIWQGEVINRKKDGGHYVVQSSVMPIIDSNGDIVEYISVRHDVTEIYEANEAIKKKDKLIEKQTRVAALGEMMDAIAHQWKQPLSVIKMLSSNLEFQAEYAENILNEEISNITKQISNQVDHLSGTIDEFREFFRPDKPKNTYKLKDLVNSTLELQKSHLIKNNVEIVFDIDEELELQCIKTEFIHVVINVINNAIDAFNENNIKNRNINICGYYKFDQVIVEICDNAGGIPENILPNVFNSNFTTKEEGKGTGIGLYLVKQIIEKINGSIEACNKDDGACFIISLN